MNVELVLSQLDSLIENRRTDLVEGYLREKMEEATESALCSQSQALSSSPVCWKRSLMP